MERSDARFDRVRHHRRCRRIDVERPSVVPWCQQRIAGDKTREHPWRSQDGRSTHGRPVYTRRELRQNDMSRSDGPRPPSRAWQGRGGPPAALRRGHVARWTRRTRWHAFERGDGLRCAPTTTTTYRTAGGTRAHAKTAAGRRGDDENVDGCCCRRVCCRSSCCYCCCRCRRRGRSASCENAVRIKTDTTGLLWRRRCCCQCSPRPQE